MKERNTERERGCKSEKERERDRKREGVKVRKKETERWGCKRGERGWNCQNDT